MSTLLAKCASLAVAQTSQQIPTTHRYRARLAYDGTNYKGYQLQNNAPTVQGAIEKALLRRFPRYASDSDAAGAAGSNLPPSTPLRAIAAGRTDAGVHARGQAVHFDLDEPVDAELLELTLNRMLPREVRLSDLEPALETCPDTGKPWHAMYWATGKRYVYRFHSGSRPLDPLRRLYVHAAPCTRGLDLRAMSEAAALFVGEHDFGAFASHAAGLPPGQGKATGTVRRVHSVRLHDEGGGYARVEFVLKGALYKMVRNMMGALYEVGQGARGVDTIERLLEAPKAELDGKPWLRRPAPAHGLTLEEVYYSNGWDGAYDHPELQQTVHGFSEEMAERAQRREGVTR